MARPKLPSGRLPRYWHRYAWPWITDTSTYVLCHRAPAICGQMFALA